MSHRLRTYLPETDAREAAARALDAGCEAAIRASQSHGGDLSGRHIADQLGFDESHLRHLRGGIGPWHGHRLVQCSEVVFEAIVAALRVERARLHPALQVPAVVAATTLGRSSSELTSEILAALADGRITPEERAKILAAVVQVAEDAQAFGGGAA